MLEFSEKDRYNWEDFLEIVRLLRSPGGCPWDREQTHSSIRRNFLEETWEALDAIDRDNLADMREELGDVLLQVAFHAQMEAERGRFAMDDVVDTVTRKLRCRHPHVFGDAQAADGEAALNNWEARKRMEKGHARAADAIEAVPHTLPALWRAEKISKKAAKAGFDWSDPLSAMGKLEEEVRELRQALEQGLDTDAPHGAREEIGDVLFIAASLARMCGVDPEDALHRDCDKFNRRFRLAEDLADRPMDAYTEEELIALWKRAKARDHETA